MSSFLIEAYSRMLGSCFAILASAAIFLAAWSAGRPVIRALRIVDEQDGLEMLAWSTVTGLVLGGLIVTLLGLCQLWHAHALVTLIIVAALIGIRPLLNLRFSIATPTTNSAPRWLTRAAVIIAAVVIISS